MEVGIFWFSMVKLLVPLAIIGFSTWLMVRYNKKEKKTLFGWVSRGFPIAVVTLWATFMPVRLEVQDGAEQTIQNRYDKRPTQEEIVIDRHDVEEYSAPDNQEEIDQITEQQ